MEFQEAYDATNPDPAAYGISPDAEDAAAQLKERRTTAAQNLLAGVAANEAYWASRSPLEALAARASGHASIGVPPDQRSETDAAAIETTATDSAAAALAPANTSDVQPPLPDNPAEAIAKLRAQVEAAGGTPEA